MSRVVHIQTQIQTVFGVLDGEGNVVPQEPIIAQVTRFDASMFAEAHATIKARRDELEAASAESAAP